MNPKKLHIVAVTGVISKAGRFLIIKRSKKEIAYPDMWTVPGGKVEAPEDCLATLKREIKEEVGIEIKKKVVFLRDYEFTRPDGYHVIGLTFTCRYKSGKVKLSDDFTDFAWITIKEAQSYEIIPGVYRDIKLAVRIFKTSF